MVGAASSGFATATMSRSRLALTGLSIVGLALASVAERGPLAVWNATASVPIGLYLVVPGEPQRGSMAVIRLPGPIRAFAHMRGYLPASALAVKPVVALQGDILCRLGNVVSINGRVVALARNLDGAGRPLPRWRGCQRLRARFLGVVAKQSNSFDSRYFGPIDRHYLVGIAIPLWTASDRSLVVRRE